MANTPQQDFQFSPYWVDSINTPGFNWERFQNKIDVLPDILYNILIDEDALNFIKSLAQKYIQLSVQGPDIARLIRDVVIADVFIGDMPKEIASRLGVDQATAREIANLIVSQLFAPVIEDLKKIHNEKFPGRLPAKPVPQAAITQTKPAGTEHYQGEDLPESGGNIIDLRQK